VPLALLGSCVQRLALCAHLASTPLSLVDDDGRLRYQILEFIHCLVETLDRHFDNVCELDIMSQVLCAQPLVF
jgi:hypothetical protein